MTSQVPSPGALTGSPKEKHYYAQLHGALVSGGWLNEAPGKAPNGAPLSWSELLRKFGKHAGHSAEGTKLKELAGCNYELAVLLASCSLNEDEDYPPSGTRDDEEAFWSLDLGTECALPEERRDEVREAIKSSEDFPALAYYAYALNDPRSCLDHLAFLTPEYLTTALASLAPSALLIPPPLASARAATDGVRHEVRDGRAWKLIELWRCVCLKGMSTQLLHPSEPHLALEVYRESMPLFHFLGTNNEFRYLLKGPTRVGGTTQLDFSNFTRYREMWRWVERILWRGACLAAKVNDVRGENALWQFLEKYTLVSAPWPPNFRSEHRGTVTSIWLRALLLRYGGVAPSSSAALSRPAAQDSDLWIQTALPLISQLKHILSVSTSFPRAGERNVRVEEAVDICGALWEASLRVGSRNLIPYEAERKGVVKGKEMWMPDILWWATKYTFNSARVLRWMVKVFWVVGGGSSDAKSKDLLGQALTGDTREEGKDLARRALKLYIGIVGKAHIAWKQGAGAVASVDATEHDGYFEDKDTDENWVRTLIWGARMLCREAGNRYGNSCNPLDSINGTGDALASGGEQGSRRVAEDVKEAKSVLLRARERLGSYELSEGEDDSEDSARWRRLHAELELAEGIVEGLEGVLVNDSSLRPAILASAHAHLLKSVEIHATPQGWFNLAVSYMRGGFNVAVPNGTPTTHGRDLDRALECAAKAVDGNKSDVKAWHLLGLVLSAMEKWQEAIEVLESAEELSAAVPPEPSSPGAADAEDERKRRRRSVASMGIGVHDIHDEEDSDAPGSDSLLTVAPSSATFMTIFAGVFSSTCSGPAKDQDLSSPSQIILERIYNPLSHPSSHDYVELFPGSPPSPEEIFEEGLQVRMTKVKCLEVLEGGEGAERGWVDVFAWVADWKKRGERASEQAAATANGGSSVLGHETSDDPRRRSFGESMRSARLTAHTMGTVNMSQVSVSALGAATIKALAVGIPVQDPPPDPEAAGSVPASPRKLRKRSMSAGSREGRRADAEGDTSSTSLAYQTQTAGSGSGYGLGASNGGAGIGIIVSPASPDEDDGVDGGVIGRDTLYDQSDTEPERSKDKDSRKGPFGLRRRSSSMERSDNGTDTSKSKKMQQKLKSQVHRSQQQISAIGKKIGHGVVGPGGLGAGLNALGAKGGRQRVRRTNSAPDFHKVLQQGGVYQASSIHSRRRITPSHLDGPGHASGTHTPTDDRATPSPLTTSGMSGSTTTLPGGGVSGGEGQRLWIARENRLLSDLWLMSAATFRRLGKIEQAKGAIHDAECKDEGNVSVWVQLALYYTTLGSHHHQTAIHTLQKGLFIDPDNVEAVVHLSRLLLSPPAHGVSFGHQFPAPSDTSSQSPDSPTEEARPEEGKGAVEAGKEVECEKDSAGGERGEPVPTSTDVDLACGLLTQSSGGRGWDVPEVWYFLSKAYQFQRRKALEMEALTRALELAEGRGVREVASAVGLGS